MNSRIYFFFLAALTAASCGTGDGSNLFPDVTPDSPAKVDGGVDVKVDVPVEPDIPAIEVEPDEYVFDFGKETPFVECEPGDGCFGDKCTDNSDCQSSWCVEHMGESTCTTPCQEDCPPGWTCRQMSDGGPDLVFVCVSDFTHLCRPCTDAGDCKTESVEDVCVSYGAGENFCGGACDPDAPDFVEQCPWGFSCKEVETVDGVFLPQCVADAGECPCTDKSVALGLFTPCEVTNEYGSCAGMRVCAAEGLLPCDALVPALEICNGVDDNCDGDVDEPNFVEGKYVDLCNDGNDCTTGACKGADGCEFEILTEGECVDGDACTVGDHCEAGECVGLPTVCDDNNACTDDYCDGLGGCMGDFNQQPCDDEDPCTVADQCTQGECVGYAVDCECLSDADCAPLEDADLCNGTLFCDTASVPFQCALVPDSVTECEEPAGQDAVCLQAVCAPDTGECSLAPDHDGFACDDGNPCTVGDKCAAGECLPGVPVLCSDDNLCTDDSCNPAAGCQYLPNEAACSDGDACTWGDVCFGGSCQAGDILDCDDGNQCTGDSCDPALGCVHAPAAGACDDLNACTAGDHCDAGVCVPATFTDCDDGNPCTKDTCDADAGGCAYEMIAAPCDDGDPCTASDQCSGGLCIPGPGVDCNDGNPCTLDSCGPDGACLYENFDLLCDDGNACTYGDHCSEGQCTYLGVELCDDDNICTTDLCNPAEGCLHVLNQAPCDDGDTCSTGDHCHLGQCIGAGELACNDLNPCTTDSCDSGTGCQFVAAEGECDDGTVCTVGDHCVSGFCVPESVLQCNDGNQCTDDSCDSDLGCLYETNTIPCDDGNACTTVDTCTGGACLGGPPENCDDGNPCTDDSCDPNIGCQYANNLDPCDDGNACTANEACLDGQCQNGLAILCNDLNICTDDSCDEQFGCLYVVNQASCEDGDVCTVDDYCEMGDCLSGPAMDCDDQNVCTEDICLPPNGCDHPPVANGTPCGFELECKDGLCKDICEQQTGNVQFSYNGSIATWTVPECVESVTIEAWGAEGGKNNPCPQKGGRGARMKGDFTVVEGDVLRIVVAQKGQDRGSNTSNQSGSGGGGSFVWKDQGQSLLIAAGGGGGGAICTSGGSPSYATGKDGVTGTSGTSDTTNAQQGGSNGSDGNGTGKGKGWNSVKNNPQGYGSGDQKGGYGGGGKVASSHGGGGGGGYSGGGGMDYTGNPAPAGGGGGSFNGGSNQSNTGGVQTGNGKVVISW